MTASNFDRALPLVLKHEGGYVNHPKDPGGATNKGVTQATYNAWRRGKGQATQDVRLITSAEVAAIYRRQYWDAVRCDDLPPGVDYAAFDYAVNSGPGRAAKDLQRTVGASPDGSIGANTIAAVMASGTPAVVAARLCDRRLTFLKGLKTWATFGKGWARRVADVRSTAVAWAASAPLPKPAEPWTPPPAVPVDSVPTGAPPGSERADPADVAVSRTPEGVGGIATGTGTIGAVVTETAQQLTPLTTFSEIIKWVFVALMLAGVALTIWALWKRRKEAAV